jgi:hypothetical protein
LLTFFLISWFFRIIGVSVNWRGTIESAEASGGVARVDELVELRG